jgi:hypothetical protein
MSHRVLRIVYLVLPLALIAAFFLRPTPIVGVDGESLAASTGAPVNEINSEPCTESGDLWTCTIPGPLEPQPGDPGPTRYQVEVDFWGCWKIKDGQAALAPGETTGCVTIADHVTSID